MRPRIAMRAMQCAAVAVTCSAVVACGNHSLRQSPAAQFFAADTSTQEPVYVRLPASMLTETFVKETGFNRDHKRDSFYAFGYFDADQYKALDEDARSQIDLLDAKRLAHFDFDGKSFAALPDQFPSTELFEDYHNYEALTAELQNLAAAYPNLVTLASAGKSVQGRELWYLKISDNPTLDEGEPNLLYIANMHGDEVVGREMMIYLSRHLLSSYESSPEIKNLVDNAQIYIMPSMNPDGFERHTRYNANNADLNRNFPDFTSDPSDTQGNRQPETKAIMALHAAHHFVHAINFHGGDVCFNMPWDTKPNTRAGDRFGDDALMSTLAREYADANRTMSANNGGSFDRGVTYGYEWYEVDGGMQDWSNYYRRSFHATVELSYTKWPSASTLPGAWDENRDALVRYLQEGIFGVHLNVVDEAGMSIEGATIGLASSSRELTYDTSVIHRATTKESQTVRISKSGYQSVDLTIDPSTFDGNLTTVTLSR